MDRLTKEERETYISIDEFEDMWIADTSIQKDINKFIKQGWTMLNKYTYPDGQIYAAVFTAPRNAISIRAVSPTKTKKKRVVSEEQKQKMQEGRRKSKNTKT